MLKALARGAWRVLPEAAKTQLRGNSLFKSLSWFAYPERKQQFDGELGFYQQLFRSLSLQPRLIFDVGANAGEKAAVFVALDARVVAVEPTPELAVHLRERFRLDERVTVAECAVSSSAGTTVLWRVASFGAMNTISPKNAELIASGINPRTPDHSKPALGDKVMVETKTLDALIAEAGRPDYIKIDVEGHEKEVIEGLSSAVPLLSLEANLPEFVEETVACVDRLCAIGPEPKFNARELAGFLSSTWMSAAEMKDLIRGGRPYLEIFAHRG